MGKEYTAKVFKSGNSLALRLPKALGFEEGDVMRIREEHGNLIVAPDAGRNDYIDLEGIFGSIRGITRPACDENPRDWSVGLDRD
jgi:antitoxin VapB